MKIIVCSKKDLRSQWIVDKSWFNDKNRYFISIAGLADGCEYPCPKLTMDSLHVLHLLFDDVTEKFGDDPNIILFSKKHAIKINEFVKNIPNTPDVSLYINCAAGISRSGAVGSCLNEYFNNNNPEDFEYFKKINYKIQPNPFVKRILNNELFGNKNYDEIFKNEFTN